MEGVVSLSSSIVKSRLTVATMLMCELRPERLAHNRRTAIRDPCTDLGQHFRFPAAVPNFNRFRRLSVHSKSILSSTYSISTVGNMMIVSDAFKSMTTEDALSGTSLVIFLGRQRTGSQQAGDSHSALLQVYIVFLGVFEIAGASAYIILTGFSSSMRSDLGGMVYLERRRTTVTTVSSLSCKQHLHFHSGRSCSRGERSNYVIVSHRPSAASVLTHFHSFSLTRFILLSGRSVPFVYTIPLSAGHTVRARAAVSDGHH
ncbi:hypothetical protein J6590_034586 [Homalodisca vitripennis]|nr:hypothetical protein J6590_034586 [Homalodisca vitripennis]